MPVSERRMNETCKSGFLCVLKWCTLSTHLAIVLVSFRVKRIVTKRNGLYVVTHECECA